MFKICWRQNSIVQIRQKTIHTMFKITFTLQVKERALHDYHKPARTIVEDATSEIVDLREPEASRPNPDYLTWAVNRERQTTRPADSNDLDFEVCCSL